MTGVKRDRFDSFAVRHGTIRGLYNTNPELVCGLADAARLLLKLEVTLETNLTTDAERHELKWYDELIDSLVKQEAL